MWIDASTALAIKLHKVGEQPIMDAFTQEPRDLLSVRLYLDTSTTPFEIPYTRAVSRENLSLGFASDGSVETLPMPVLGAVGLEELRHFNFSILNGVGSMFVP